MSRSPIRPGTPAPRSGQYREVGPRGGKGPEVTVPKDHKLPPTTQPGAGYILTDPTDNNSGKPKP